MEMVNSNKPAWTQSLLTALSRAGLALIPAGMLNLAIAGSHTHADSTGTNSLDVYSDGNTIHLLIGETKTGGGDPELLYLHSEDGETWSPPVRVDAGLPPPHSVHRGMDPQIAAFENKLVAVWMTRGTGYADSGPLVTALSTDGGKTWAKGPNPSDDGSTTGHGFIDIASDERGRFYLTWLDSRDGGQGLRFSSSQDSGKTWTGNVTVKAATCECCWNAIAAGKEGQIAILFRNKGPRDMSLAWSGDSGVNWSKPHLVGGFGWEFEGCPHVGGGVAVDTASTVHTVVWNGDATNRGVFYLKSKDEGISWTRPHRLGDETASHPDLATSGEHLIAAVWDIYTGAGTDIQAATSRDGGKTWSEPFSLTNGKLSATNPRLAATSAGFRVFWTDKAPGEPARWRCHLLEVPTAR